MVWGCMSTKGPGNLYFIEGIMDQNMYLDIPIESKFKAKRRKNWITEIIQILSG